MIGSKQQTIYPNFGHTLALHFGDKFYDFCESEEQTAVVAEVGSYLSSQRTHAKVSQSILTKFPVPTSDRTSIGQAVKWLLKEGYAPTLKGKKIKFYAPASPTESPRIPSSALIASDSPSASASSSEPPIPTENHPKSEQAHLYFDRAINYYNSKIKETDNSHDQALVCPITGELFKDPVMDEHGHTFEKAAIEEWLERQTTCPLTREPINALLLKPNRVLKDLVEKIHNKSPIPLLPIMEGRTIADNTDKAYQFVYVAKNFAQESHHPDPDMAIEMLTKAFALTTSSQIYGLLPAHYEALNQDQKAVLAYLYLAKLQLQEGQFANAETSITNALKLHPTEEKLQAIQAACLMMQGELQTASRHFQALASGKEVHDERTRKTALDYWEQALACDPTNTELYAEAEPHCQKETRTTFYIKAILHLNTPDPEAARTYYQKAIEQDPNTILARLARLSCLDETHPETLELYRELGRLYEETGSPTNDYLKKAAESHQEQDIKPYLAYLLRTKNEETAQKVYLDWINRLTLPNETIILEAIERLGRRPAFLEHLLNTYIKTNHPSLPHLITELGEHYENTGNWSQAERIYSLANDHFKTFESQFKLATTIMQTRPEEGIHRLFEISTEAQGKEEYAKMIPCLEIIKKLDPYGTMLRTQDQQSYLLQQTTAKLFRELRESKDEIAALKSKLTETVEDNRAEQTVIRRDLEVSQLAQEAMRKDLKRALKRTETLSQEVTHYKQCLEETQEELQQMKTKSKTRIKGMMERLAKLEEKQGSTPFFQSEVASSSSSTRGTGEIEASSSGPVLPAVLREVEKPALAFGAAEWNQYFGDVGVEPPLPPNIEEILGTNCPFWPGQTIRQTHVLTLVPATVNGRAFTLDYLGELIQMPKSGSGGHKTKYGCYHPSIKAQEGRKSVEGSYWVLMTRDVIPGTRSRSYSAQKSLLASQVVGMRLMRGGIPTLMEAVVAVLMEHVRTGRWLYGDSPWTYTRCQEVVRGCECIVGGFAAAGLDVYYSSYVNEDYGLACSWKF